LRGERMSIEQVKEVMDSLAVLVRNGDADAAAVYLQYLFYLEERGYGLPDAKTVSAGEGGVE